MYLNEMLCTLGILAFAYLDMRMGIKCYERYVAVPRLKELRRQTLEIGYLRAKVAEKAMRKSANDRLRRAKTKNLVSIGRKVLGKTVKFPERKVA